MLLNSARNFSSVRSIFASIVTRYPSARVTRLWMPSPSTMTSATRLQSTPSGPCPMMASATMPTWVSVSTNQAWSSPAFFMPPRPPPPLPLACSFSTSPTIDARSGSSFPSVTVTSSFFRTLSGTRIRMIRSAIVVENSGSGTWHFRFIVSLSRGSPVLSLSSSPPMVTVTFGWQCRFSRSHAQLRSALSVSAPLKVSTFATMP